MIMTTVRLEDERGRYLCSRDIPRQVLVLKYKDRFYVWRAPYTYKEATFYEVTD